MTLGWKINNEYTIKLQDPSEILQQTQASPGSANINHTLCLSGTGSYKTWEGLILKDCAFHVFLTFCNCAFHVFLTICNCRTS